MELIVLVGSDNKAKMQEQYKSEQLIVTMVIEVDLVEENLSIQ